MPSIRDSKSPGIRGFPSLNPVGKASFKRNGRDTYCARCPSNNVYCSFGDHLKTNSSTGSILKGMARKIKNLPNEMLIRKKDKRYSMGDILLFQKRLSINQVIWHSLSHTSEPLIALETQFANLRAKI